MADGGENREGQQTLVNVQVNQEMLKETLRELFNKMPGLRTLAATGSSAGSTANTSGMSTVSTGTPPAGGEFIRKISYG